MALIILSGLLAFLFLTSFALIITEPFPPLFSTTLSFSLCSLLLLTVSVTLFLTIFFFPLNLLTYLYRLLSKSHM